LTDHLTFDRTFYNAAKMSDAQLYEEQFQVNTLLDQAYDRVHRVIGISQDSTTSYTLDINCELYPLIAGESFTMLLASTLNLDGTKDEGQGWRGKPSDTASLADMWDYVCYGKVYKVEDPEDGDNM
jgi:hypothetical protein